MTTVENNASILVCHVDQLQLGDIILTPAHLWETVTGLDSGEAFARSTRVATDETGPDHPREWASHHRLLVQRRPVGDLAQAIPLIPVRSSAPSTAAATAALRLAA